MSNQPITLELLINGLCSFVPGLFESFQLILSSQSILSEQAKNANKQLRELYRVLGSLPMVSPINKMSTYLAQEAIVNKGRLLETLGVYENGSIEPFTAIQVLPYYSVALPDEVITALAMFE